MSNPPSSLTRNSYRVPRKEWRQWSELARKVFNETYTAMAYEQHAFLPPGMSKIEDEYWTVIAYKAAWMAAHAVDDDGKLD